MLNFRKFWPLAKVDEATRTVYGVVTGERPDRDDEVLHYTSTVPYYKDMNEEFSKATDGKSIAPLREMHQLKAAGVGKSIDFRDANRQIAMGFKVVDDDAWKKVMEGVYTGFSQGGNYVKTWRAPYTDPATKQTREYTWYTAKPGEISLVDSPCLKEARFELVKANGMSEQREFKKAQVASVGGLPPVPEEGAKPVVPPPYGQTPGSGVTVGPDGTIQPAPTGDTKCSKCGKTFKAVGSETMCPKCAAAGIKAALKAEFIKAEELTHEQKERVLRDAVSDKYNPRSGMDMGAPSGKYCWMRDFTDAEVYVDCDSKTYKIPYKMGKDGEITFGDPIEVRQTYEEVGKADLAAIVGAHMAPEAVGMDLARVEALIAKVRKREAVYCAKCGKELSDTSLATAQAECCKTDLRDPASVALEKPLPETAALKAWEALTKAGKTKRKGGKDLHASDFAYVGDPDDIATWKYPIHDAAHVRNALARWGQHKGIPSEQESKVLARIRAAAKKFGIEVSAEAKKIALAYQFLMEPDMSKAAEWTAEQLAEVHDTVEFLKAAAAEEGDNPEDVAALLDKSIGCMTSLVELETRELEALQAEKAALAAKENKTMEEFEQLEKVAQEELAKARSAGDLLRVLGTMHKAHHSRAVALAKGHMDGCTGIINRVLKAVGSASVSESASASASVDASKTISGVDVAGAGPAPTSVGGGTQGAYPGQAHPNDKAFTLEDVVKLLDEKLAKSREQSLEDMNKIFIAMYGEPENTGGTAPGIGDRTQVLVKAAPPVTHPAGPKENDTGAVPPGANAAQPTKDDVVKGLTQGDIDAKLKLARLIKAGPVPAHLMAPNSPAAALLGR
jgi:hypothetical protein